MDRQTENKLIIVMKTEHTKIYRKEEAGLVAGVTLLVLTKIFPGLLLYVIAWIMMQNVRTLTTPLMNNE